MSSVAVSEPPAMNSVLAYVLLLLSCERTESIVLHGDCLFCTPVLTVGKFVGVQGGGQAGFEVGQNQLL